MNLGGECNHLAMVRLSLPARFRSVGGSSMFSTRERAFFIVGKAVQLLIAALAAVTVAARAHAQSPVGTNKTASLDANRQASLSSNRTAPLPRNRHTPLASNKQTGGTSDASCGVASFYAEDSETASGEKFDEHKLTAAHYTAVRHSGAGYQPCQWAVRDNSN
jgi:hypothetical protein